MKKLRGGGFGEGFERQRPRSCATNRAVSRRKSRLADLPAVRDRREERRVGFDQQAVLRQFGRDGLQVLGILEGDDARQRDRQAQVEHLAGEVGAKR